MNPWIQSLSEGAVRREEAGDKAWRLSVAAAERLPVPDGFIVTRAAFAAFNSTADDSADGQPLAQLERHLRLAFDDHFEPDCLVAVRSSALGEDGANASFAGQHKTLYFVDRDGLVDAVQDVWRSLEDSAAYRDAMNVSGTAEMAVIVQVMVDARSSGVCFASDPLGEVSGSVVESVWGLGAALVDGRVTPDRFNVTPEGELLSRRISRKPVQIVRSGTASARLDAVAGSHQRAASISDTEAGAIARLTTACSELAGSPQDVEWSIDRNGELKLLQSRPITAAQAPESAHVDGAWVAFKPILENFTEPLSPLTVDLAARVLPSFGRFIDGRFYVSADALKRLLPLKVAEHEWADVLLLRRNDPPPVHVGKALLVGILGLLSYPVWGSLARRSSELPGAAFDAYAGLCERVLNDGRMTPPRALWRLFLGGSPWAPIAQRPFQANVSAGRYFLLTSMLRTLLKRWAPQLSEDDFARLTSTSEDVASAELIDALNDLANIARASTDVTAALNASAEEDYASTTVRLSGTPFATRFAGFLDRFGHRGVSEVEIMSPRWREEPASVLALIRHLMGQGDAQPSQSPDRHGALLVARDRLHQAVTGRWQRWLVDRMLTQITDFVRLRENTRNAHIRAFDVLRRRVLLIEQTLLANGSLKCPDDIFFLTWREIEHLLDHRWQWRDAEPVVRQRRQRYNDASERGPRLTINMPQSQAVGDDHRLQGQCASPGVVEGIARVVLKPGSDTVLTSNDILVAPYTDPSWTPLFPAVAAIVVEVGSYLSHAGTVAREFGTPCIVDVYQATQRLRDGERIRVDATNGEVTRLEHAEDDAGHGEIS